MDIRRLLTTIILAGALMLGFQLISSYWFGTPAPVGPPPAGTLDYTGKGAPASEGDATPVLIKLGKRHAESTDKLWVTVNSETAGIELAQLNPRDYAEHPKSRKHPVREPLTLLRAEKGAPLPYSTLGVHITLAGKAHEIPLMPVATAEELARDTGPLAQ